MLGDTFDAAFGRLVTAFRRYHDTPRSPDTVPALGAARWQLHLARGDMARERMEIVESASPPKPVSREP